MGRNNKSIVTPGPAHTPSIPRANGRTVRRILNYGMFVPCYNFVSPERVNVEADPVISSAGGSIIPRIIAILVL
jgi:hypothetical protein